MVRRWVPKKAPVAKGWRRTGRKRRVKKHRPKSQVSLVTQEKRFSCFPEALWTKVRMTTTAFALGETAGAVYKSFLLNSFGDGVSGLNGCGPQTAFAGTFALNYPTGHYYLCGSQTGAGGAGGPGQAPYYNYVVTSATMRYRVMPTALSGAGHAVAPYIRSVLFQYKNTPSPTTVSFQTWTEQPEAVYQEQPNPVQVTGLNGLVYATESQKFRGRKFSMPKLYGVTRSQYLADPNYWANSATGVGYPIIGTVGVIGDGALYTNVALEVQIDYTVKYFNRNILASAQNL